VSNSVFVEGVRLVKATGAFGVVLWCCNNWPIVLLSFVDTD
jgi:hypothetical protein